MSRILTDECFDRKYLEQEIEKIILLKQGRIEGYGKGFDEGEFQAFNHGRKKGYNNGFNDGELCGYENGYDTGYNKWKENYDNQIQQAYKVETTPVIRKGLKKDMTIVKKNTIAEL